MDVDNLLGMTASEDDVLVLTQFMSLLGTGEQGEVDLILSTSGG